MPRSGELHVIKECSEYAGLAGEFCTIKSSNLEEIVVGARVATPSPLVKPRSTPM
jgi:hypothetical protein